MEFFRKGGGGVWPQFLAPIFWPQGLRTFQLLHNLKKEGDLTPVTVSYLHILDLHMSTLVDPKQMILAILIDLQ